MAEEKREKHYWLHRITGGDNGWMLSYPLLNEHSILSTGWSDFSKDSFVCGVNEHGMAYLEETMMREWKIDYKPRNRWCLYYFIHEMRKGDIVIVPQWGGVFSICEIEDDEVLTNESLSEVYYAPLGISKHEDGYLYKDDERKCVDLGFYRKVKVLHSQISRSDYAEQDLISRMKIMQTNAEIGDIANAIDTTIKRADKKCPINLRDEMLDGTCAAMQEIIKKWTDADKFEELIEKYLYAVGADYVSTPAKNESSTEDGDADRVATFEWLNMKIYVQAKKHKDTTNDWGVEQIIAYQKNHEQFEYREQLWLVSNADTFTQLAQEKAEAAHVLRLINGKEFARMLLDVGVKKLKLNG